MAGLGICFLAAVFFCPVVNQARESASLNKSSSPTVLNECNTTRSRSLPLGTVGYNIALTSIPARKHFSAKNARLFSLLINIAIYLRAGWKLPQSRRTVLVAPISRSRTETGLCSGHLDESGEVVASSSAYRDDHGR